MSRRNLGLALLLIAVLSSSNFFYQATFGAAFGKADWSRALERSWFQAVAVLIAAWWLS